MGEERDYILGTDSAEIRRLRFQHEAWLAYAQACWRRAGIGAGDIVLDLGCGPGYTTFDLAALVTGSGRVIARDISHRFLHAIETRCAEQDVRHVETSLGSAEDLALPAGSLDAAYSRWMLCWLVDPQPVPKRVAHALKPGGVFAIQDYLDWGAMSLLPNDDTFDRAIAGCMRSFAATGAEIDVGRLLPTFARRAGLEVIHLKPIVRIGAAGSDEWRWLGAFLSDYLPKVVREGHLTAADHERFTQMWRDRTDAGETYIHTPTMFELLLRKP